MLVELKIDDELRGLLPPLSIDEKEQLEKNIIKEGYVGSPIYTWDGYIVDGHNRYEICKKHSIVFKYEELFTCDKFTKTDVMEWMINTQLGRRNLIPAQRLLIVQKFKERVRREAKNNLVDAGRNFGENHPKNKSLSPKGETLSKKKIHTDKELAKMAGVGSGTQARFDQVMKHGDDELKQKVLSGEVKITPAYDLVKSKKEEELKREQIKDIILEVKSEKSVDDYWNFKDEIDCIVDSFQQPIDFSNESLFEMCDIDGKITIEERNMAIHSFDKIINQINELKNKIKNIKSKGEM